MKKISVLIIAIASTLSTLGQDDTLPKTKISIQDSSSIVDLNEKVSAYKLLYKIAQKNNDDLRDTTHWTIGMVIGFILLILGSQFLYNWRLNKQEITQIKNELELRFQELQNSLTKERENVINDLKKDISTARKENQEYLKERFENHKDVNKTINDLLKKEVDREILKLRTDIQEIEADVWLLKGVEANALAGFIKTAQYKLELGQELKYTFNDIIPILSKMEEIHDSDYNNLKKLISDTKIKFPGKYDEQLGEIETNYKNKQTYIYQDSRSNTGLLAGFSGLFTTKKIIRPKK